MLVDLGGSVPQWFELYNQNPQEVDLTGWKLYYRKTKRHIADMEILYIVLTDIKIPARGAIILATYETKTTSVDSEKIYVLRDSQGHNINLKLGWKLTAPGTNGADDIIISEQPRDEHGNGKFGEGNVQRRFRGKVKWKRTRTSFEYRRSEEVEQGYYGHINDISTPGFYEPHVPKAPSLIRKSVTTWASLKKE